MRTEVFKSNLFILLDELKPLLNGVSKDDWKEVMTDLLKNDKALHDYLMLCNKIDEIKSYDSFLLMCKDENYLLTDKELEEASSSVIKLVGRVKVFTDNGTELNLLMKGHYRKLSNMTEVNQLNELEMVTSKITNGISESILTDENSTIVSIDDTFYLLKNEEVIGIGTHTMYGKVLTRIKVELLLNTEDY